MKFEDPIAKAYAEGNEMEDVVEENEEIIRDKEDKKNNEEEQDTGIEVDDEKSSEESESDAENVDEEDTEEVKTEMEDNKEQDAGYDGLKEAYANNEGIKEVIEDNEEQIAEVSENLTEKLSFEKIGKQGLESMLQKISNFVKKLIKGGEKAIYTATGVALESPAIAEKAYASARESFDKAVDSAKEKAQEVKAKSIERAEEAKTVFSEKVFGIRDKYVGKALKLKERGTEWRINKAAQVEGTINQTCKNIDDFIENMKIETAQMSVEKNEEKAEIYRKKAEEGRVAISKLMEEIGEKGIKTKNDIGSMSKAFNNVGELAV